MSDWNKQFKHPIDYTLLENGSFILLESGDKIILEQTGQNTATWNQPTKN